MRMPMHSRRWHRRPAPARGFTLIEVLVAIVIFAAGVLGMVALQVQATRLTVESSERNRASLMANELIAAMWAAQSTSLGASALSAWAARLTDETSQGLRDATYNIGSPDGDGAVTITITWTSAVRGASAASGVYATTVALP